MQLDGFRTFQFTGRNGYLGLAQLVGRSRQHITIGLIGCSLLVIGSYGNRHILCHGNGEFYSEGDGIFLRQYEADRCLHHLYRSLIAASQLIDINLGTIFLLLCGIESATHLRLALASGEQGEQGYQHGS